MQSTRDHNVDLAPQRRAICIRCATGGKPTCVCGGAAELAGPGTAPYLAPAVTRVVVLPIRLPPPVAPVTPARRRQPAHRKARGRKRRGERHSGGWSLLRRLLRCRRRAAVPMPVRIRPDHVRDEILDDDEAVDQQAA